MPLAPTNQAVSASVTTTAAINIRALSVGNVVGVQHDRDGPVQHRIVAGGLDDSRDDTSLDTVPSLSYSEFAFARLTDSVEPGTVDGIMSVGNVVAVDRNADFDTDFATYEPTWDIIETDERKAEAALQSTVDDAIDRYGEAAVQDALTELCD